jgi:hypothetical protein
VNPIWIIRGMFGAAAGFVLAQVGGAIGHGREPSILVPVLILCLLWWVGCTIAAFATKEKQ